MKTLLRRILQRQSPDDARIKATAIDWISRRAAGNAPALETEFLSWMRADPRHEAAIAELQPGWARLSAPRLNGHAEDLRRRVHFAVSRRRKFRYAVGIGGFALATMIAVAFVSLWPIQNTDGPARGIAIRPDYETLADGSSVELNAGASIVSEYTAEVRRVHLVRGEALFHVMPDGSRPFVVEARGVSVRAVGTAFNVRLDSDAVDVLVTHGKVAVERPRDASQPPSQASDAFAGTSLAELSHSRSLPILVEEGNRLKVPDVDPALVSVEPQVVSVEEVETALNWRSRRVEFSDKSLAEVTALFNRGNTLQLAIADSDTGAIRITGVFWTNDPDAFSRALNLSLGVSVIRDNESRIVLKK